MTNLQWENLKKDNPEHKNLKKQKTEKGLPEKETIGEGQI